MVLKDDKGWLGYKMLRYALPETAHMTHTKLADARELAERLRKLEAERRQLQHQHDEAMKDALAADALHPERIASSNFDVALSFASEERPYVERVAILLKAKGVNVFYDHFQQAELWGKDLYQHLADLYQHSTYVIVFASKHYVDKRWTKHELESAQARSLELDREYILLARFDDTELPSVKETVAYVDLRQLSADKLTDLIVQKLTAAR